MSKEIELKMIALPGAVKLLLPGLLSRLGVIEVKEAWLANTYFDTCDLLLNKACVALRIRQKGDRFIQTLKTKGETIGGLSRRGEWEWDVPQNKLDVSLLRESGWPDGMPVDSLVEVFETNFKRTSAIVEYQGARIELAFDDGYISAGEIKAPLVEIELEIIEGDVDRLFDVAAIIAKTMPIMLSDISKAEKGYRLRNKGVSNQFSYSFGSIGCHKAYVKGLVSRNLSHWLFLVDRLGESFSVCSLIDLVGVLIALREVIGAYEYVDDGVSFEYLELIDLEIKSLSAALEDVLVGGQTFDLDGLLSSGRAGVLSIELSRWLRGL